VKRKKGLEKIFGIWTNKGIIARKGKQLLRERKGQKILLIIEGEGGGVRKVSLFNGWLKRRGEVSEKNRGRQGKLRPGNDLIYQRERNSKKENSKEASLMGQSER